jgi:membrane protein involved in colicin uptake
MSEIAMEAVRADALASRSAQREDARREAAAAAKAKAKKAAAAKKAKALAAAQNDPQSVAKSLLDDYGFGADQWQCLQQLWTGESAWNYQAANASSGAYGIPQSLPGSKMASAGADWKTNPETQIRWGLGYIKDAYGSPCSAWNTWNSRYPHWY